MAMKLPHSILKPTSAAIAGLLLAGLAHADETSFGTFGDAKVVLEKTIKAMEEDKDGTIKRINAKDPDFAYRDIYPSCASWSDGNYVAHPMKELVGKSMRDMKDAYGKPMGSLTWQNAKVGDVYKVTYMWPRPPKMEMSLKVGLMQRTSNDLLCGVGFYR